MWQDMKEQTKQLDFKNHSESYYHTTVLWTFNCHITVMWTCRCHMTVMWTWRCHMTVMWTCHCQMTVLWTCDCQMTVLWTCHYHMSVKGILTSISQLTKSISEHKTQVLLYTHRLIPLESGCTTPYSLWDTYNTFLSATFKGFCVHSWADFYKNDQTDNLWYSFLFIIVYAYVTLVISIKIIKWKKKFAR